MQLVLFFSPEIKYCRKRTPVATDQFSINSAGNFMYLVAKVTG